ncbi:metal ABC transporter solute-binding protein, Zn/Mn family [Salsuginibacillus kocurii]|uniref:metal ABC transporter solute-binding protein, Zn/Mn family n=1 Tax=Salsuginibacillus kocurii TaxID=427078 RepID=UPI00036AA5D6|nr:zinc ABC transporter substrate-binding protein [Salsuginibacillus kocurii]
MKRRGIAAGAVFLFIISACGTAEEEGAQETQAEQGDEEETEEEMEEEDVSEEPLHVYTTVYALEDLIREVGGDYVEVENIVPPGADAHTYEPSMQTMVDVADGDLLVYNGVGMEGFADTLVEVMEDENVPVVKAAAGIELAEYDPDEHTHSHDHEHSHDGEDHSHHHDQEEEHDHHHGDGDPHVWIDPTNAKTLSENITEGLKAELPEAAEKFETNKEALHDELEQLDNTFQEVVDGADKDTILVSHAGYTYWQERYGIQQLSVAGVSPTNEPSPEHLHELQHVVEDHGLNHIIFEHNYVVEVAEVLREEVGAEALYFHNLEALLEEEVEEEPGYVELMEHNIETLEQALNE